MRILKLKLALLVLFFLLVGGLFVPRSAFAQTQGSFNFTLQIDSKRPPRMDFNFALRQTEIWNQPSPPGFRDYSNDVDYYRYPRYYEPSREPVISTHSTFSLGFNGFLFELAQRTLQRGEVVEQRMLSKRFVLTFSSVPRYKPDFRNYYFLRDPPPAW